MKAKASALAQAALVVLEPAWRPRRVRALLLGVTIAGGCAVYEIPTTTGGSAGAAGGDGDLGSSSGGHGSGGERFLSFTAGAGQAGASDGDSGGANATTGSSGAPTGSGGEASQGGEPGTAGASGSGGESAGAAGSTHCAARWRSQSACEDCATQTQPDLQACAVILDCYVDKSCGPSSCASTDQKCGPNVLGKGVAAYQIAQTVYDCICN